MEKRYELGAGGPRVCAAAAIQTAATVRARKKRYDNIYAPIVFDPMQRGLSEILKLFHGGETIRVGLFLSRAHFRNINIIFI